MKGFGQHFIPVQRVVAVLDFGSTVLRCVIARLTPNGEWQILGSGLTPFTGLKAGAVSDMTQSEMAIRKVVEGAEQEAGFAVSALAINVSSRYLHSKYLNLHTPVHSGVVSQRDMKRLLQQGLLEMHGPDQAILHAFPLYWALDGECIDGDSPLAMCGQNLAVYLHFVMVDIGRLRNLAHCIGCCHLRISSMNAAAYMAARAVLDASERDLDSVGVIDLGGGLTSLAILSRNRLMHVHVLPMGGGFITQELARQLNIPLSEAERIKRTYGSALIGQDDDEFIDITAYEEVSRAQIVRIIHTSQLQIFEQINSYFEQQQIKAYGIKKIILTGGGAYLSAVRDLAEMVFRKPVRIGEVPVDGLGYDFAGPSGAAIGGLLTQVLSQQSELVSDMPDLSGRIYRQRRYKNKLARLWGWVRMHT